MGSQTLSLIVTVVSVAILAVGCACQSTGVFEKIPKALAEYYGFLGYVALFQLIVALPCLIVSPVLHGRGLLNIELTAMALIWIAFAFLYVMLSFDRTGRPPCRCN